MHVETHAVRIAEAINADPARVCHHLERLRGLDIPISRAGTLLHDTSIVPIATIDIDDAYARVHAWVEHCGRRPIWIDGEEQVVVEGRLIDGSGSIPFTAWDDFPATTGDQVHITGAAVNSWEGAPTLNFPKDTQIAVTQSRGNPQITKPLAALHCGDRGVRTAGSLFDMEIVTVAGMDGSQHVRRGVIADGSARLPITDWSRNEQIASQDCVLLDNVYVQEWNGLPTVNCSRYTNVDTARDVSDIGLTPRRRTLCDIQSTQGVIDTIVCGTIVGLRDGSGLIHRCPTCDRVLAEQSCRRHGDVEGYPDLRTKAVLDDGTGTADLFLGTEITETIYDGDVDAGKEEAQAKMHTGIVREQISNTVIGRSFSVRGRCTVDKRRVRITATAFDSLAETATERAQRTLEDIHQ